jgi:hypothetical protein
MLRMPPSPTMNVGTGLLKKEDDYELRTINGLGYKKLPIVGNLASLIFNSCHVTQKLMRATTLE